MADGCRLLFFFFSYLGCSLGLFVTATAYAACEELVFDLCRQPVDERVVASGVDEGMGRAG